MINKIYQLTAAISGNLQVEDWLSNESEVRLLEVKVRVNISSKTVIISSLIRSKFFMISPWLVV